jgi:dTDP-4-amino-4,6-dideoxygalactose transaminase
VITVANTCVPTVVGIERTGATPVLVDADEATWTIDPRRIEAAVTARTRAIVPVHLYGRVAATDEVAAIARAHGLAVLEDAAQAHGATGVGRLGDAAAFSFYPTKNLGALGDAGAVATDDDDVAERARRLRSYGEARRYDSVARGWNSRLDPIQAAVLMRKLPHLDDWNRRRSVLAAVYRAGLDGSALGLPAAAPAGGDVHHLFVVRVADRAGFRTFMSERGVETLVHYPRAVHEHPAYAHLAHANLGTSETLAREVVSLPLYPELTVVEADAVVEAAAAWRGR